MFKLASPPQPNWKLSFGLGATTYFYIYVEKPPNRFQRWMIKKVFNIHWTPVE